MVYLSDLNEKCYDGEYRMRVAGCFLWLFLVKTYLKDTCAFALQREINF